MGALKSSAATDLELDRTKESSETSELNTAVIRMSKQRLPIFDLMPSILASKGVLGAELETLGNSRVLVRARASRAQIIAALKTLELPILL